MRIGIDLGGTKIEAVLLAEGGREAARRRTGTPRGDYDGTVRAIRDLAAAVEAESAIRGRTVGVGMPGVVSPFTGLVKNANSTWLIGRPFDRDLAEALARPVRLANDANCFALSEAADGAGAGAQSVFGAILGTGVGGGIVMGGRLQDGPNRIAGEWGHNPMPWPDAAEWPGPACYCGRHGCIEALLSGPAFERDHRETAGRALAAAEIVAAAATDAAAAAALARYAERLAKALAAVINLLDPEVIVLGGGMSNVAQLYEAVPRVWGRWVFSDRVATRLAQARFGDSSGVRGAARLFEEAEAQAC